MHDNIYIDFKKELDQSKLMHYFLKHRFQITLDQSVGNSSEYSIGNEVNNNKLLIESKKEIEGNCDHENNAKLVKETKRIEQKYRSKLDNLTNQVKEYTQIIENKNEEIRVNTSKIIKLEKKSEKLKEVTKFYLECFLDVYHLET